MRARTIQLACLAACSLFLFSAFAGEQGITAYTPNSNGTVAHGCFSITFVVQGVFTGKIGNMTVANAANTTMVIPLAAVGDNQRLGEVTYTLVGAGSLSIIEVR